jgi:hypothetical protein
MVSISEATPPLGNTQSSLTPSWKGLFSGTSITYSMKNEAKRTRTESSRGSVGIEYCR